MVETINKLTRIQRQLIQELGREPTAEEIAEKMKHFEVDSSKVQTGGDVRLRFDNRGRSDARARVGVVISSSGVAAPDALYDKVGKQAIAQADEEAAKSREKFQENRARIEAEKKQNRLNRIKQQLRHRLKPIKKRLRPRLKLIKQPRKHRLKQIKKLPRNKANPVIKRPARRLSPAR